ncbi:hypothetical protein ACFX12_027242 [Malus domestica]
MSSKPHAAILCSPGLGHLIPVLELAKRLVIYRNFTVTIFAIPSPTSKVESELLEAATTPKFCDIIDLPPPDISGCVGPNATAFALLAVMMREVRPAFRNYNLLKSDGILMNTWDDLEHKTLHALRDEALLGRVAKVPVCPIGPLTRPVQLAGYRSKGGGLV